MNLIRGRARGDGISQPSALANAFQRGDLGTAADCCGLHGLVEEWAAPMGRLPRHDERPDDRTGQVARGQTSGGQGNLEAVDVKVIALGDSAGGQGRLPDRTAERWCGGRDRGRDTRTDTDVATSLLGRGLRVPPH